MKIDDLKLPVDYYEMKARMAPALLISLPILVTLWSCYNKEFTSLSEMFEGILSIVIVYSLSIIVRALGKKIELELWKSWGGAPSSQIVFWRNRIIGDDLKQLYLQKVRTELKLPMPTREDEEENPEKSAELINQSFKRIQGSIRQKDKNGLWAIANADYGFARNLLGSRLLWFITSLIMTLLSAYHCYYQVSNLIVLGLVFNIIMVTASICTGWYILPEYTKQLAYRYAEHAWESFYNIKAGQ